MTTNAITWFVLLVNGALSVVNATLAIKHGQALLQLRKRADELDQFGQQLDEERAGLQARIADFTTRVASGRVLLTVDGGLPHSGTAHVQLQLESADGGGFLLRLVPADEDDRVH